MAYRLAFGMSREQFDRDDPSEIHKWVAYQSGYQAWQQRQEKKNRGKK